MVDARKLASYYSEVRPFYRRFLKQIFSGADIEKLKSAAKKQQLIPRDELDSMILFEARNFLRLSIFNLLAYKFLMCGKYLAWGRVTLYYSYFYSICCLLRLAGCAVVHVTEHDYGKKDNDKSWTFQFNRENSAQYRVSFMTKPEHRYLWNMFSTLFPNLSTHLTGRLTIEERIRWNYELLYPSQATEEHAVREVNAFCENNFLDPNFGKFAADEGAAEYFNNLIENFGYEEMYAGDLIKESLKLFVIIAKSSVFKQDYADFTESLVKDVHYFDSRRETKEEITKWLRHATEEIMAEKQ